MQVIFHHNAMGRGVQKQLFAFSPQPLLEIDVRR